MKYFLIALDRWTWQFLIIVQIMLFYDPRELYNKDEKDPPDRR